MGTAAQDAERVEPVASPCGQKDQCLPEFWMRLLAEGQVFTALLLGTSFSEKYKGRDMRPGDRADLRLPCAGGVGRLRRPTLLERCGSAPGRGTWMESHEAVAFVWRGDEVDQDKTLYVAFGPLRRKRQLLKIWGSTSSREAMFMAAASECPETAPNESRAGGGPISLVMGSYVSRKLRKLWGGQGLQEALMRSILAHPGHRVIFTGISHGAALAQAAALQSSIAFPAADIAAVTWNAYRWTDAEGSALVAKTLGCKLLPFVMSRQAPGAARHWDSVAGFPSGLAPMPRIVLMDADSGSLLPSSDEVTFSRESTLGPEFALRAMELHFAKVAIKATRAAMCAALGPDCAHSEADDDHHLDDCSDSDRDGTMFVSALSFLSSPKSQSS